MIHEDVQGEFKMILLLTNNSNSSTETTPSLLSNNNEAQNAGAASLLSSDTDGGFDGFAGKDIFGTVDFSNMNETFFSASAAETTGSVAYNSAETAGSVAYTGGAETAGSVACGSESGGSSFSSVC